MILLFNHHNLEVVLDYAAINAPDVPEICPGYQIDLPTQKIQWSGKIWMGSSVGHPTLGRFY